MLGVLRGPCVPLDPGTPLNPGKLKDIAAVVLLLDDLSQGLVCVWKRCRCGMGAPCVRFFVDGIGLKDICMDEGLDEG